MTDDDAGTDRLTEAELSAEFAALFPRGWGGPDVLAELAPDGWDKSPLAAVFHPTAETVHAEAVRVRRNLAGLGRRPDAPPPPPDPTLEEIKAEHEETPVEPERECRELVGRCLWDVFSDNHEVRAADGRVFELGSHRAAGGFLAKVVNEQGGPPPPPRPGMDEFFDKMFSGAGPQHAEFAAQMRKEMLGDGGYTYLDFYMGARMEAGRADLSPVYRMIFRRLRARGLDWKYTFPRLYLADLRPLKKMLDEKDREGEPEFAGYDPSAAFEEAEADRKKDEELAEMRAKLDEGHREAVAAARQAEPPAVVRAYRAVYGDWPQGWPPEA